MVEAAALQQIDIEWKNGKLVRTVIQSGLGGNCRLHTLQPVKVQELTSLEASGNNPNPLYTTYGKPPYEKNANAPLPALEIEKGYTIDFPTEKGKTYTIVPQ